MAAFFYEKIDRGVIMDNPMIKQVKELTDKLEQGIQALFESKKYRDYLNTMSKFHNYSFNNVLLIAMQRPDASLIAGYTAWNNLHGRHVKKGEKAIKILAPTLYKVKTLIDKIDEKTNKPVLDQTGSLVKEEVEIQKIGFKIVNVFDVSQTEGREIPTLGVKELAGNVHDYALLFNSIKKISPVPVAFELISSGAKGYYHQLDKRIAINEGMSELQNVKTLIHEASHAMLHDIDLNASVEKLNHFDRRTKEVQAESIAYVVCQHYGLNTSDYSFGYIAGWSSGRDMTELKDSLETIRITASAMITEIDKNIRELDKSYLHDRNTEKSSVLEKLRHNQKNEVTDKQIEKIHKETVR